ncbi:uncharacterized, partial [Tachysurus ichikawai]
HGSLQEPSPSSIGNAYMKKAVGQQAASKASCALAGNRTRASRVAGENSTTEPPMPTLKGQGHLRQSDLLNSTVLWSTSSEGGHGCPSVMRLFTLPSI